MVGPNRRWWPEFLLLGAVWGATFLFMRLAVVEFGVLPTAALRALIGALVLLPFMLWRGHMAALASAWPRVFAAGVLNSSLPTAGLSFALLYLTTGVASVVNATVPLFGALLAWLWLGQRPGTLAALGLAGGFAGVAALTWDSLGFRAGAQDGAYAMAVLAAAGGAASGAFSALFSRRYLEGLPVLALAGGSQVGAALGLAIPALLAWPHAMPSVGAWLAVIGSGVVCTGAGYLLFFRLIERAGPTRAITVTFVMPLFAMFYGFAFLHEGITLGMVACAALIIGSTGLTMRPRPSP